MIRFIMFFFLLALIFFSGVAIGAEHHTDSNVTSIYQASNEVNVHSLERDTWKLEASNSEVEKPFLIETIARSLEKIFFVFFEIVVELLYQITNLFF